MSVPLSTAPARIREVVTIGLLLSLLVLSVPILTAVSLGGDEGIEFSKALLFAKRPELIPAMWNDQPLLHTLIIGCLYRVIGNEVWLSRIVTLACAGALLFSMNRLLPPLSPNGARFFTPVLLLTWSTMIEQSVSGMIELPAIAMAILSAAAIVNSRGTSVSHLRLVASGLIFAAALHIKLTAALVAPALLAVVLFGSDGRLSRSLVWFISCSIGFLALAAALPNWSWAALWKSHQAAERALPEGSYAFAPSELLKNAGAVLSAGFALYYFTRRRLFGDIVFPLVLLLTAFFVHLIHRPWWWYYNIHFAVPVCLLGAAGLGILVEEAFFRKNGLQEDLPIATKPLRNAQAAAMTAAAAVALFLGFQVPNSLAELAVLRRNETITNSPMLRVMKEYSARTRWVFALGSAQAYAFHAGLLIPPELAVIPKKRVWTGDLPKAKVLALVKHYAPEQIIVSWSLADGYEQWQEFLATNYVRLHTSQAFDLYISRTLNPPERLSDKEFMQKLGL